MALGITAFAFLMVGYLIGSNIGFSQGYWDALKDERRRLRKERGL